ncbi:MAG: hypothetical protein D6715_11170 [Calditrichaeota bacterium]|nr:MAG: hypothetical protein D6715_11170 [Calditrichota bacterium]
MKNRVLYSGLLIVAVLVGCAARRPAATLPPSQRVQLHFSNWLALYEPYAYHIVVEDPLPPETPVVYFQHLEPPFLLVQDRASFEMVQTSPGVFVLQGYFSPQAAGRWRMRVRVRGKSWVDSVVLVHYFRVY